MSYICLYVYICLISFQRLKTLVPRQADLSLQQISDSFQNKAKILESKIVGMQFVKQQQAKQIQEEKKVEEMERVSAGFFLWRSYTISSFPSL